MVIVEGTIPWAGDPRSCKWREGTDQPFASLFLSGCRKCSQLLPAPTILDSGASLNPFPPLLLFWKQEKIKYHLLCQLRCWQCWQSVQRNAWSWARQDQERGTGMTSSAWIVTAKCHSLVWTVEAWGQKVLSLSLHSTSLSPIPAHLLSLKYYSEASPTYLYDLI